MRPSRSYVEKFWTKMVLNINSNDKILNYDSEVLEEQNKNNFIKGIEDFGFVGIKILMKKNFFVLFPHLISYNFFLELRYFGLI